MTEPNHLSPSPGSKRLTSLSAIDGIPGGGQSDAIPLARALAEAMRKVVTAAGDVPGDLRPSTYSAEQDPTGAWAALIQYDHLSQQDRPVDLKTTGRLFDILHRLSLRHGIVQCDRAPPCQLPANLCEEVRDVLARFEQLRPDHTAKMRSLQESIDPARYTARQLRAALELTFSMLGARHRAGFRQSELDSADVATFLDRAAADLPMMDLAAYRYWSQVHFPEQQWREEATASTTYEDWLQSKAPDPAGDLYNRRGQLR